MDVTTVRTFLAAVSAGSFAAAARRVHASPSAVTERIKQLEHHLRVRLFDRDKGGCRLTSAGKRFVVPAQNFLRAWDHGCAKVALPPRFSTSVRMGGQHALWPTLLIPLLQDIRMRNDGLAIRAIAAAPAQLNRELHDDELDIAFLYDPILEKGLRIEELAPDQLLMVTARPGTDWRENYVRIDWGESVSAVIGARLGDLPNPGFELDLGILSLDWLIASGSCGFVPGRLALEPIKKGQLTVVENVPTIDFSPFACWRESLAEDIVNIFLHSAKQRVAELLQ